MDFISLNYFLEATKDLNFTQTSKRLFISQQNLSNHIARLEDYYGVKLFERKPRLKLTYAGEILREYANNERLAENNLRCAFDNLKSETVGELHIGSSPNRTSIMINELIARFLISYPNVKIYLHQHHSIDLWKRTLLGELDFSISISHGNRPNLVVTPLINDYLLLLVKKSLLHKHYGAEKVDAFIEQAKSGISIHDFADLPIMTLSGSNLIETCYFQENCKPNITISSNYPQVFVFSYYQDYTAAIIPYTNYQHIKNRLDDDIFAFPVLVNGKRVYHQIAFIRHLHKYLPPYGKYFFDITQDYCRSFGNFAQ